MGTKSSVLVLVAWMLGSGCAKGASETFQMESPSLIAGAGAGAGAGSMSGGTGGTSGAGGAAGTGEGGAAGGLDAGLATFVGDPCERDATEACACAGSAVIGERSCLANAASPTGGAFSDCRGCPAEPPDAGTVGGMGGMGGMGGTGAAGASGMGGASGMSGMSGGMGGAGGTPACMCMDALECCRPDGSCGIDLAGICL